jgi:hypothetical protein
VGTTSGNCSDPGVSDSVASGAGFIAKTLRQVLPLSHPTPSVVGVDHDGEAIIQLGYESTGGWDPYAKRVTEPYLLQEDLYLACEDGILADIKMLIERNDGLCDVKHEDGLALCVAARSGHTEAVAFLLPLVRPMFFSRVFEAAVGGKNLDVVSLLLLEDNAVVSDAAFEHLIVKGAYDLVEGLVNSGRVVPTPGAMELACLLGKSRLVDFFLARGIQVSQAAVDLAFQGNRVDLAQQLIPYSTRPSLLLTSAIQSTNPHLVRLVLADVRVKEEAKWDQGNIMARWAITGNEDILNLLLEASFQLSANNNIALRQLLEYCRESGEWEKALLILREETLNLRGTASFMFPCPPKVVEVILRHPSLSAVADCLPIMQEYCVVCASPFSQGDDTSSRLVARCLGNMALNDRLVTELRMACVKNDADTVRRIAALGIVDGVSLELACNGRHSAAFSALLATTTQQPSSDELNRAFDNAVDYSNTAIIKILLADPRVDPSRGNNKALRRLRHQYGADELVNLLLQDARVQSAGVDDEFNDDAGEKEQDNVLSDLSEEEDNC